MHILFLTDNFPPEVNAPATRTFEHIMEWEKRGARITVITGAPNFPLGKVFKGYKNHLIHKEKWDDHLTIVRVWTYLAPNKGILRRTIDYFSFAVSSFLAGLFVRDVDVIIATSPQFFTVWSGWLLSVVKRRPWIFELRDLWPQSIETVGVTSSKRILRFLERIELFLYRRADHIVSVIDSFVENLVSRGIRREKISVVKNGVSIERFFPIPKDAGIAERYGLEGKTVVGYIGTLGMAHNIFFILKALAVLDGYKFMFIGDGAQKDLLVKMTKEMGLRDAIFTGMVPKKEIHSYISVIDIALVNLKKSPDFTKVIPSKIFELCAMGKPILLGVEGEAKELVERYGAGIAFDPENTDDFIRQLERLRSDRALYDASVAGGAQLAKDFDRGRLARDMYAVIERVASRELTRSGA
jgi:hypothetical protein